MTQQFVKSAQERLATWNWCKNSAFFNKSRANQNHIANPLNFRFLPHCVATFWNFPEQSFCPQDRAICANQKYPLLLTQWILCTYTQLQRPFLLSRQEQYLPEHLHICMQPHTNVTNCMHICVYWIAPAKASVKESCGHELMKAKKQNKYAV